MIGLVVLAMMAILAVAPVAQAAWPGRDGLLAVQPARGAGVLLLAPSGKVQRRVCPQLAPRCPVVRDPVFSPDGRELAFDSFAFGLSSGLSIVYADGSCLSCGLEYEGGTGTVSSPAFDRDGNRLIFTDDNREPGLWTIAEDGIGASDPGSVVDARRLPVGAGGHSPAVSVDGRIAFVRRAQDQDRVLVTNRARTLATAVTPGDAPAWSPDGRALAFEHAGLVQIVAAGGTARALVRGSAPAWSPNGRWLAFLDPAGYVSVVAAGGGVPRRLGHVRGRHVDWQPLIPGPPSCTLPARSRVLMHTPEVTITETQDRARNVAYIACDRRRGLLRLLDTAYNYNDLDSRRVFGFVSAGRYVAFQEANYSEGNVPAGPVGSVVVWMPPKRSTPTHRVVLGQETD